MGKRICRSQKEIDQVLTKLKTIPCPHCKYVGSLIGHGVLKGYDQNHWKEKNVRARRIFCSNRNLAKGCGRTFSLWTANKVKRLFLNADSLWDFLKKAVTKRNKMQAFRSLKSGMSDSAPYRIWKRFYHAQSAIRAALVTFCKPPQIASQQPAELTLAHLQTAFQKQTLGPIAAFQVTLQTFFV